MDIGQIQDVTDSLALMPDAALQKYAMMNKDDPYIMSLAMSENNRRQKLRTAQQGQAGQMPAPKVVDQAIASINPPPAPPPQAQQPMPPPQAQQPMPPQQAMPQAQMQLPEDQGIAQLPAPNMQGMADGGIVGYAVGGVPEGAIIIGNMYKDPATGLMKPLPEMDAIPFGNVQRKPQAVQNSLFDKYMEMFMSNESIKNQQKQRLKESDKKYQNSPEAVATPTVKPAALPSTAADQGRGKSGGPSEKELLAARAASEKKAAAPKTDTGIPSLLKTDTSLSTSVLPSAGTNMGASASQSEAPETDPTKIAAEYAKIRDAYTPVNRFGKEIGELTDAEAAMHEQSKAQLLADIEKRGPAMADYEKRLKGKEDRLSKQEADLPAMSIVEAGLAMMAGTSTNALLNIGAGAQTGVKSYKAGLEKLSEARDKLDESFAKIEELRRSEGMLNDKEIRQATKDIAQTKVKARELGLNALIKDGELGRKEAENAFNTMATNRKTIFEQVQANNRTAMQEAGQNTRTSFTTAAQRDIARMQEAGQTARSNFSAQVQREIASMPGATERMYATLGGGNVKKGFEYFTSATAEGKGSEAIIQAVIKSPEILGAVSPELRQVIEKEVMGRFVPQTIKTPPAAQVRAP